MDKKIRIGGGKSYLSPKLEVVTMQTQQGYAASVNLEWCDYTKEYDFGESGE